MHSAWARKLRLQYELMVGGTFFVLLAVFLYVGLSKPPTCYDGKQNEDEIGVDCGGICNARCAFEVQDLQLLWSRPFPVSEGFWNAVAYVENPNFDSYAEGIPYIFSVYDEENVLILEREGVAFITGDPVIPIFSGGLDVGSRVPRRANFEWKASPYWLRLPTKHDIDLSAQRVFPSATVQEVEATLHNREVHELRNIVITALVYGKEGNAIAASETLVEFLGPLEKAQVTWTWPQPFTEEVGRIELIPRIPIQRF
jgi:hypothetical protein